MTGFLALDHRHPTPLYAQLERGIRAAIATGRLASGDSDEKVKIWDLATRNAVHTLLGHTHYVSGLAFSPNGKYFASASWREVIVWDANTFAQLTTLGGLAGEMFCVTFSPDSQRLAASGGYRGKGEIKIWDATLWENQAGKGR